MWMARTPMPRAAPTMAQEDIAKNINHQIVQKEHWEIDLEDSSVD